MSLDMKRLIAVLGRLGSDADAEVMMAARLATRMLRDANKTWEDLLAWKPPPLTMPSGFGFRTPPSKRGSYGSRPHRNHRPAEEGRNEGSDIQDMLSSLAAKRHDMHTMMFIASLNDHWERKSYLTDPQYAALKNLFNGGQW